VTLMVILPGARGHDLPEVPKHLSDGSSGEAAVESWDLETHGVFSVHDKWFVVLNAL
jgi:hypothetical protein